MFSVSHKKLILEQLANKLENDLSLLVDSAKASHEAATHEESRADNKYDTRGLEASYLAGAQALRANEIRKVMSLCRTLEVRSFSEDDPIAISALIEVSGETGRQHILLVPFAGGESVEIEGTKVQVVSSASPLGSELMGRRSGDDFEFEMRGRKMDYSIGFVI